MRGARGIIARVIRLDLSPFTRAALAGLVALTLARAVAACGDGGGSGGGGGD